MKKIDTHQHLIYPQQFNYPWLGAVPALCDARFGIEEYMAAASEAEIIASVFMEVDVEWSQAGAEACFFLKITENHDCPMEAGIAAARP